jgi:hypothetical protein
MFTLYYTRKAVLAAEEGTKDADRGLEIAARNADAAAQHVKIARDNAHRQMRAYVTIMESEIGQFEPGKIMRATLKLKNTGLTPAKALTARAAISCGDPIGYKAPSPDLRDYEATWEFGAQQEFTLDVESEHRLDAATFRKVKSGKSRLFVEVHMLYGDVFDKQHGCHFLFRSEADFDKGLESYGGKGRNYSS